MTVAPEDRRPSRARAQQAHQQADGRGLPGPVGAEEAHHLPGLDPQAEPVDGELVAEALAEPFRLDHDATAAAAAHRDRRRRRGRRQTKLGGTQRIEAVRRHAGRGGRIPFRPRRRPHTTRSITSIRTRAPVLAHRHPERDQIPVGPVEAAPDLRVLQAGERAQRPAHVDGPGDPLVGLPGGPRAARRRRRAASAAPSAPAGSRAANSASVITRPAPDRCRPAGRRPAARCPRGVTRERRRSSSAGSTSSIKVTSQSSPSDGIPSPSAGPKESSGLGWNPTE